MPVTEDVGIIRYQQSLLKYNTWRIGGNANQYYRPTNLEQLSNFCIQNQNSFNNGVYILGLGSNLLVRDCGYVGTIIHFYKNFLNCKIIAESENVILVRVEAGVLCPQFAKFALQHNMSGVEFLVGIPGTVGGALAMNAGAFGSSTWEHVVAVETIDLQGCHHVRKKNEYAISYRTVKPKHEIFIAGIFQLVKVQDVQPLAVNINKSLEQRKLTQPIGSFSCGSVFKNPEGLHAGQLIESVKLKGTRIGGAMISDKHANFILNVDQASSDDIEKLIALARQKVYDQFGITLELEVKILGE